jgi:hypothetical protein
MDADPGGDGDLDQRLGAGSRLKVAHHQSVRRGQSLNIVHFYSFFRLGVQIDRLLLKGIDSVFLEFSDVIDNKGDPGFDQKWGYLDLNYFQTIFRREAGKVLWA